MLIFWPFLSLLFHLGLPSGKFIYWAAPYAEVFTIHLLPPRAITQVRRKALQNNLCLLFFSCHMVVLLLLLLTSPGRRLTPRIAGSPLTFNSLYSSSVSSPWILPLCPWPIWLWTSFPCHCTGEHSTIFFLKCVCVCHSVSKPEAAF